MKANREKVVADFMERVIEVKETARNAAHFLKALNLITTTELDSISERISRFGCEDDIEIDWEAYRLLEVYRDRKLKLKQNDKAN